MSKRPLNPATSNGDGPVVADTVAAGGASSATGEASLAGASENTREGLASGDAARAASAAIIDGRPEDASRAAEAASGTALNAPSVGSGPAAEPFGRTIEHRDPLVPLEDISLADIALDRPTVVVGGPTVEVDLAAGIAPALMSREGAFGSAPEASGRSLASRLDAIEGGPRLRSTGYKRAAPLPKDRTNVADLIEQGFDLIVTAKQDGFRRAGVGHPSEPTLRRREDFAVEELEAMDADPMLVVQALR